MVFLAKVLKCIAPYICKNQGKKLRTDAQMIVLIFSKYGYDRIKKALLRSSLIPG